MHCSRKAPPPAAPAPEADLATLKAAYERVCHERDRLRDARGYFSRPLGPAPASAGISTALVTALGSNLSTVFLWLALGALAALVLAGMFYDGKLAYRHLYARTLPNRMQMEDPAASYWLLGQLKPGAVPPPADWYRDMIERELRLIGPPRPRNRWRGPWRRVATLQDGLDSERTGLRVVQTLWLAVIVSLVLAVLTQH